MVALGPKMAGVLGNDQAFDRPGRAAAADAADEPLWQLPLEREVPQAARLRRRRHEERRRAVRRGDHRRLFLSEFVGDTPWAHLDIAGPMKSDADDGWLSKGATGFGTRLLIELAVNFRPVR